MLKMKIALHLHVHSHSHLPSSIINHGNLQNDIVDIKDAGLEIKCHKRFRIANAVISLVYTNFNVYIQQTYVHEKCRW